MEQLDKNKQQAEEIAKNILKGLGMPQSVLENVKLNVVPKEDDSDFTKEIEEIEEIEELYNYEEETTPQDIIKTWYYTKHNIENLISDCIGLDHIVDKYLEVLELEKAEARKALGEDNIEFFKLL